MSPIGGRGPDQGGADARQPAPGTPLEPPPAAGRRGRLAAAVAYLQARPMLWAIVLALTVRVILLATAEVGIVFQRPASTQFLGRDDRGLGYTHTPVQLVDVWTRWDGHYYLSVVEKGYDQPPGYLAVAFFPLYPLAIRGLMAVTGLGPVASGLLIANVCSVAGWALLALLAARRLGTKRAALALVVFAAFPTRNFDMSLYTEGPFLLLSVGAFLAYEHRRWGLAALAAALVSAVRPQGVLVGAALLADALLARIRRDRDAPDWGAMAALSVFPAGMIAYASYLAGEFGRPLLFMDVQKIWHRTLTTPVHTILWPAVGGNHQYLALGAALVAAFWMVRHRAPVRDLVYAGAALLLPLTSGSLQSMARFVGVIFPLFLAAALGLEGRRRTLFVYFACAAVVGLDMTFKLARGDAVV